MDETVNLFITIGAPASGKSTYARYLFEPHEIVSSDHARYLICGDDSDQTVTSGAWNVVYSLVKAKLLTGQPNIIVDGTCAKRKDRRNLLKFVRTWMPDNAVVTGLVFAPKLETLIERDAARERTVGEEVIQRMLQSLKSAPPSLEDGFDHLLVINNDMNLKIPSAETEVCV